jgi:hypothetical protein
MPAARGSCLHWHWRNCVLELTLTFAQIGKQPPKPVFSSSCQDVCRIRDNGEGHRDICRSSIKHR